MSGMIHGGMVKDGTLSSVELTATGVTAGTYANPTITVDVAGRISSAVASPTGGLIPVGGIILWSGSVGDIPTGWHLCDGGSGTPDLRNRFVVGAGGAYSVGGMGGSITHYHGISGYDGNTDVALFSTGEKVQTDIYWETPVQHTHGFHVPPHNTSESSNAPPYYALAYIMRVS